MRTTSIVLLFLLMLPVALCAQSDAVKAVEVTAPGNRQLRLAVETLRSLDAAPNSLAAKELVDVIAFDMNMSGVTTAETREQMALNGPVPLGGTNYLSWSSAGFELLVRGEYSIKGDYIAQLPGCRAAGGSLKGARNFNGQPELTVSRRSDLDGLDSIVLCVERHGKHQKKQEDNTGCSHEVCTRFSHGLVREIPSRLKTKTPSNIL